MRDKFSGRALIAVLGLVGAALLLAAAICFFGADPPSCQKTLLDHLLQISLLGAGAIFALIGVTTKSSRDSKNESRHLPRQNDEPED